jgi:hypothetical protein
MSDSVESIAAIDDPIRLLRKATERLATAQRDVTELGRLRRRVIQDLIGQGMSYGQIAEAAGLSKGRIHQIRHKGPAPEGAFLGTGLIRIITPLKRDEIKGRPVVAVEDVAASQRLEDLAHSYGFDVEREHISLDGEVDLNRSSLIVICGPRLSESMGQLYERDPVIHWEQTTGGAWALRDTATDKLYVSGSDRNPAEDYDAAYLGRLPRPDGKGQNIVFTGIHPQGTLGVVDLLTSEIDSMWSQLRDSAFSVVLGVTYDPDTHEPVNVEKLTPFYRHDEV